MSDHTTTESAKDARKVIQDKIDRVLLNLKNTIQPKREKYEIEKEYDFAIDRYYSKREAYIAQIDVLTEVLNELS